MNVFRSGDTIAGQFDVIIGPAEDPTLQGGMGFVYFCLDRAHQNRPVALKTFRSELDSHDAQGHLLREAATWVQLGQHPHIVSCYGVKQLESGGLFLVLQLIAKPTHKDNASLRSWLGSGSQ